MLSYVNLFVSFTYQDCLTLSEHLSSPPVDSRGRDHMVVGFTTTYAISAYRH